MLSIRAGAKNVKKIGVFNKEIRSTFGLEKQIYSAAYLFFGRNIFLIIK